MEMCIFLSLDKNNFAKTKNTSIFAIPKGKTATGAVVQFG